MLSTTDLVRGNNVYFVATGVTDGEVLRGVRYYQDQAVTQSLSMRSSSGAVRTIETKHRLSTSTLIPPSVNAAPMTDTAHRPATAPPQALRPNETSSPVRSGPGCSRG